VTYSYTQISQYLSCPRRYRYRYLDGWKEKDPRAAMLFGRAFEQALAAFLRRKEPTSVSFTSGLPFRNCLSSIRTETRGTASCSKGSSYSNGSPKTTVSVSLSLAATSKSSSSGSSQAPTSLSPTSMRSDSLTASVVSWNGRPPPVDILSSPMGYSHWTLS